MRSCPCGSTASYLECCGRFIELQLVAETPEQLMRSRYTAYTQGNVDYIAATMKSPAADGFDQQAAKQWALKVKWIKLNVLKSSTVKDKGIVEFIAYYSSNGKLQTIYEVSEFRRDQGSWYYVDAQAITKQPQLKSGRNDPCPCGSGKKFKHCCL